MAITITSRIVSDVVILDLSGRFSDTEDRLRESVKSFLDGGRQHFLLNLAGVPYIGTWGISQMISIWTSIRARGGTMGLVAPGKTIREVLQIMTLDKVFSIFENEPEALEHVSKYP